MHCLAKLVHNIDTSHYQQRQFAGGHHKPLRVHHWTVVRVTTRVTTVGPDGQQHGSLAEPWVGDPGEA